MATIISQQRHLLGLLKNIIFQQKLQQISLKLVENVCPQCQIGI